MTPTTGLFANLGTAALVPGATPLGLPVSTTNVAAGSLIGVRVGDHAPPRTGDALRTMLYAWLVTLPSAALIAALSALFTRR
jgi:PiT family inorganic phosphate transporter